MQFKYELFLINLYIIYKAFGDISTALDNWPALVSILSTFLSDSDALKLGIFDRRRPHRDAIDRIILIQRYISTARSKSSARAIFRAFKELGMLLSSV